MAEMGSHSRMMFVQACLCLASAFAGVDAQDVAASLLDTDDACIGSQEECSVSLRQLRLRSPEKAAEAEEQIEVASGVPCSVPSEFWPQTMALAEMNNGDEQDGNLSLEQQQEEVTDRSPEDGKDGFNCYMPGVYYIENSGGVRMKGSKKTKEHHIDACQTRCANTDGCGHFAYWHDGGCLLTSKNSRKAHGSGVTSGPPACVMQMADDSYHGASVLPIKTRGGLKPPSKATEYNGVAWETMKVPHKHEYHIIAIGDWGGLDGTGHAAMIQYARGQTPGPHTMARWRGSCKTQTMSDCFAGKQCPKNCDYSDDIDFVAQQRVAEAMKKRAAVSKPDLFLNVGDNFYWGGINMQCGHPMHIIHPTTAHQFKEIFENIYHGPGVDGKPWLSVLGNHDWGGFQFNKGWDQQIAYTWASDRWIMPAPYFMQRVEYPDFSAEFFMIDTNAMDSHPLHADPEHNLCGIKHNPVGADCAATGGPKDLKACFKFMWDLWRDEQHWVEKHLKQSNADWQVIVTHFQCGHQAQWYKKLHQHYGLDLLVTGHTHVQNIFHNWHQLGGLTCFITGGGGGITSENSPQHSHSTAYGFFDLTISKQKIHLESVNFRGETVGRATVHPTHKNL